MEMDEVDWGLMELEGVNVCAENKRESRKKKKKEKEYYKKEGMENSVLSPQRSQSVL